MTSSLHVSLPDEMRAFVDLRANGKARYSTPSEYVRDLIRSDMEKESDRQYVMREMVKSMDDIEHGRLVSGDEVEQRLNKTIADFRAGKRR